MLLSHPASAFQMPPCPLQLEPYPRGAYMRHTLLKAPFLSQ